MTVRLDGPAFRRGGGAAAVRTVRARMTARRHAVVVAQAFKETLALDVVARAIAAGVADAGWDVTVVRGSDGGDGLLDALAPDISRWTEHAVVDPLGRPRAARVGWLDAGTAVVESRLVIGLSLLTPAARDPMRATTRGLGLLCRALDAAGAAHIVMGLGGSATVDGGLGMARVWGWVPRDGRGRELPDGGGGLVGLALLERGRGPLARVTALCDVRSPLLGPEGAAPVYGPQKGASAEQVRVLERGLARLVQLAPVPAAGDLARAPGAGAAGGLGFGLACFAGAELAFGADWMLDRARFGDLAVRAAAVVVCEGAFDRSSLAGKLAGVALARARAFGVPVLLLAPRAVDVPADVVVESGGGPWNAETLRERARHGIEAVDRLLG